MAIDHLQSSVDDILPIAPPEAPCSVRLTTMFAVSSSDASCSITVASTGMGQDERHGARGSWQLDRWHSRRQPLTPKTTSIFAFFVAFYICVVSKRRDFIFGLQVDRSYSQLTDDKPSLKGAWLRHVTRFKFGSPIHILEMAEARAHKFATKGDYINSCQKDDKSPL